MVNYKEDIEQRDTVIESMRIANETTLNAKEKQINKFKAEVDQKEQLLA